MRVALSSFMEYRAVVARTVEPTEGRGYKFVISTENIDRYRSVITASGIDTKAYMTNPVVLFNHNSYGATEVPIVGLSNYVKADGTDTIAEVVFNDLTPLAVSVERMVANKHLRGASIGFMVNESKTVSALDYGGKEDIQITNYSKTELLEWSVVVIPANREALQNEYMGGIRRAYDDGILTIDDPLMQAIIKQLNLEPYYKKQFERTFTPKIIIQRETKMTEEKRALLEGDALAQAASDGASVVSQALTALLTGEPYNLAEDAIADIVALCATSVSDVLTNELGEVEEPTESADDIEETGENNVRVGRKINSKDLSEMDDAIRNVLKHAKRIHKVVKGAAPSTESDAKPDESKNVKRWSNEEIRALLN